MERWPVEEQLSGKDHRAGIRCSGLIVWRRCYWYAVDLGLIMGRLGLGVFRGYKKINMLYD